MSNTTSESVAASPEITAVYIKKVMPGAGSKPWKKGLSNHIKIPHLWQETVDLAEKHVNRRGDSLPKEWANDFYFTEIGSPKINQRYLPALMQHLQDKQDDLLPQPLRYTDEQQYIVIEGTGRRAEIRDHKDQGDFDPDNASSTLIGVSHALLHAIGKESRITGAVR